MNIEGIDGEQRLFLGKTVKINICHDEARRATICVLEDPLQVTFYRNRGPGQPVKDRHFLRTKTAKNVVRLRHSLKKGRQEF